MAIQPKNADHTQGHSAHIHASVDRSLFSFAIGQIKVDISQTRRATAREQMRELMPRACQAQIDWLLEHAHFTERDLCRACRVKALEAPDGVLRQNQLAHLDYRWSFTFAILAGISLLVCLMFLVTAPPLRDGLAVSAMAAVFAACLVGLLANGVWPHETARRAVKALQRQAEKR